MSQKSLSVLNLLSFKGVQMRTFHITWLTFFVCFFGWFGLAPLMPAIKADLNLDKSQIGNIVIASVSGTIVARLLIGRLCDTWGPRKTYTALLLLGALPVMAVGLARDYSSFLLFRLAISIIGASFVITQYHTSMMFDDRIKGTANAVAGGWGNLGGGITNMVMPLIFALLVGFGFTDKEAWRYAMIFPGLLMLVMAFFYYHYTQDSPAGNYEDLERRKPGKIKTDYSVLKDWRVWALTLAYAVCFGMEITFDNVAALHFVQEYDLSQQSAGFWAGMFGFMNLFARALGGIFADKAGRLYGLRGKGLLLSGVLMFEGLGLIFFAHAVSFSLAILSMIGFALFLKMANGVTYAITPFVKPAQVGMVSGIVGAGGNLGGMVFGFLFKSRSLTYLDAFNYIGMTVMAVAFLVFLTRFARPLTEPRLSMELSPNVL
ncbi:MAG TPA: NarK family nitrate/nitrite MFS transporter [Saprospiraceae bacterium]|nr:NarK family nitrate/nitrite MFS transporter [Saprospiraceae bacterium]HNT19197.1 NarK family nitrate/nitrite MFS transporter [Saprospiraceae bacterium]